jgi:hypothetical protein
MCKFANFLTHQIGNFCFRKYFDDKAFASCLSRIFLYQSAYYYFIDPVKSALQSDKSKSLKLKLWPVSGFLTLFL